MRTKINNTSIIILVCISVIIPVSSCKNNPVPKPRGFFRIDFPEKEYVRFDSVCPFTFEYPVYSKIAKEPGMDELCWFNIEFPDYKGKIYLSYMDVHNNLKSLADDAHKLAYKHSVKADAIEEKLWVNEESRVYGIIYLISGNAASSTQFFVTDSTSHYLRGSLYFETQPDKDSLAPVINFFREDVIHMVETLKWK